MVGDYCHFLSQLQQDSCSSRPVGLWRNWYKILSGGKFGAQLGTSPSSSVPPSSSHPIKACGICSLLHTSLPSPTSPAAWPSYSWQKQVQHLHAMCMSSWLAWRLPNGAGVGRDTSGGRVATAFLEGAMEPFLLIILQCSRLRPLLYLNAKEWQSYLQHIISSVL